ncbi:MAG: DUF4405 domain-containing protein [Verrucomicrobia bacterium]|nr:MAG: DUF4405 domain-containing protein [Verrucomicrobiota bacterium]
MKRLVDWIDDRTGCRRLVREALFESVPGGARWRYIWGSTLTFCFAIQIITGLALWMAYSPSASTAWESVYYIQHELAGGWILRGIHHFTAQAMHVLLVLHLLQVIVDGAYRAPREVNYWFGIVLLALTLGLGLTGYLLPWDQKGYGATKVATNLVGLVPFVGASLQKLVIGGADYGHFTLTRFFALHAGILPGAMIVAIVAHVALFRRHGITAKKPLRGPDAAFWPDQVLMDAVACLAVLAAVMYLTLRHHGAELLAPANPSEPFNAARPEWYFLFLFEFLKLEVLTRLFGHHGAIVVPTLVMGVLAAMPFVARWRLGHRFNLGFLGILLAGAMALTVRSLNKDANNVDYQAALDQARFEALRIAEMIKANGGIPKIGASGLLHNDPATAGPKLFVQHCASCHRYAGHDGLGIVPPDAPGAPDLHGFATRRWLADFLDARQITNHAFYGGTKFRDGKMVKYVREKLPKLAARDTNAFSAMIAAVSAEAALPAQKGIDARESAMIEEGRKHTRETFGCTDCHAFRKADDDVSAPELTGWGSREWVIGIIADPSHPRFYGKKNDRMPALVKDGRISANEAGLLADWLRGDIDALRVARAVGNIPAP